MTERLPAIAAGSKVQGIIPNDFDSAYRIAQAVCVAGMAPRGLDTPEKAFVAIMHGLEVGLAPMQALQSIAVINGRPSIWGDGAMGLVRSSGICESIREWVEGEGDQRIAYCQAKRRGEIQPVVGKFSVADAKLAGLWDKKGRNGEPTPWVTYPDRMLQMRARAFALRDAFADVLRGLHIAEEAGDIAEPAARVIAPSPDAQRRTLERKPQEAAPDDTGKPQEREVVPAATEERAEPEASQRAPEPQQTDFYSKGEKQPAKVDAKPKPTVVPLSGRARPEPAPEPFDAWKYLDDLQARFLACKTAEDVAGVWDDALSRKDEFQFPSDWQDAEKAHEAAKARIGE